MAGGSLKRKIPGQGTSSDLSGIASGGKKRQNGDTLQTDGLVNKIQGSNLPVGAVVDDAVTTELVVQSAAVSQRDSDPHSRGAAFLNSLSAQESVELYQIMRGSYQVVQECLLDNSTAQHLRVLRGVNVLGTHDGTWWLDHCTCEFLDPKTRKSGKKSSDGHVEESAARDGKDYPRWQFDMSGKSAVAVAVQIGNVLSEKAFKTLKSIASCGAKKGVKIMMHHVAYNADPGRRAALPIPVDAGAGGSISHICDRKCVRVSHLEGTNEHNKNLQRQRCRGTILVVLEDTIVQELPCEHGTGTQHQERLLTSCCRSLSIVSLSDDTARYIKLNS